MVGIRDIAKLAGVSTSTVSYALNNDKRVSQETAEKILNIAKELNYRPNLAGRALRSRQTNIIGVFVTEFDGLFYGKLLDNLKRTFNNYNYEMIVCSGVASKHLIEQQLFDGVVILDVSFTDENIIELANNDNLVIVLDRVLLHKNISSILLDNAQGAKLAIKELVSLECDNYIILTGPQNSYDSEQRLKKSISVMNETNQPMSILKADFTRQGALELFEKNIDKFHKGQTYGIFALNDEMALGVYSFAEKYSYKIGKDFFVVGFDHLISELAFTPKLTTVGYDVEEWAKLIVSSFLKLENSSGSDNEIVYLPVNLYRLESTKNIDCISENSQI